MAENSDAKMGEPGQQDGSNLPSALLVIGMAGAGKTTFMQRINSYVRAQHKRPYVINMDPAVRQLPYGANIDIRDTVNYKEVMKQYKLGPNGGILTSLNLFATKFDKVLEIVERRAQETDYIIIDTPGQIEIFTWSASGAVITEALSGSLPTAVVYIVDSPRCVSPVTFVSNMLYACSILYKTRLPMIIVFNKADVVDTEFMEDWMTDFESLQEALSHDDSYMSTLSQSMGLVLDEFYNHLTFVSVSSVTGEGMADFFDKVAAAVKEYNESYKPELERIKRQKTEEEMQRQAEQLERLRLDFGQEKNVVIGGDTAHPASHWREGIMADGSDDDDVDEDELDQTPANEESFKRFLEGRPAAT